MVRRQIQKRESKKERQETYAKRSKGLQKKVSELSILCDVDVGLIMFSPNGKLKHYSNQPKIETVLQEFIQNIHNMPLKEWEKFVCLQTSQVIIDRINIAAGTDDVADRQGKKEVNREIIELQSKLMLLQEQERMLDPTMGTLNSEQEREEHINRLRENALIMIAKRKEELMSVQGSYNLTPGTNPSPSVQQKLNSRHHSSIRGAPPSLSLQVPPQRGQQYFQQPPPQHGGVSLHGVQFSMEEMNFLSYLINEDAKG
ncbi:agamous-like MADS-box protein AGL104 [Carex rostrata]